MLTDFLLNQTPFVYLTQSLWRDEAFTVLMSEPPLKEIVRLTALDFNPPLYYFILHFWMKILGEGEIAIRFLSFIFHLLLVFTGYLLARKIHMPRFFVWVCTLSLLFNPMLIYYAFEARPYALLAFLASASFYFFFCQAWLPYILVSTLGLWTQPFMVFVFLSQFTYLLLTKQLNRLHFFIFICPFLLFSPWLPTILAQFGRSGPMWIWPINLTTLMTILGNLLTGYEGTPGGLWNLMAIFSLIVLGLSFLLWCQERKEKFYLLLLVWLLWPVFLVLLISCFKPIYVNRYLIFVTVAEVLVSVMAISLIKNQFIRSLALFGLLIFLVVFSFWFPSRHKKLDIRRTITEVRQLAGSQDVVFAQTPLTFFETSYYFSQTEKNRLDEDHLPDRSRVFLYNPNHLEVPFYAGRNLITQDKMKDKFPSYPNRAFLIHDDGSYEVFSQK